MINAIESRMNIKKRKLWRRFQSFDSTNLASQPFDYNFETKKSCGV